VAANDARARGTARPGTGAPDGGAPGATRAHDDIDPARRGGVHGGGDVSVTVPPQRDDQVRWGPVWAGLVVALPVFLLGELLFLALGVLDVGDSVSGGTAGVVTGLIALAAFFVGGLTAGATAKWRGADTGLLHGILVWALAVVAILALGVLGGTSLLSSAGNIASQFLDPSAISTVEAPSVSAEEAREAGQSAASWALLGLGATVIASALGGLVGSKMWPRKKDTTSETTHARVS